MCKSDAFKKALSLSLPPVPSQMTEITAAHSEREAARLQKEWDAVITELQDWKDKYEEVCMELEQTFNEMAGY